MKLESPLNPYANARYRDYIYAGPSVLMTMRTTAFVENDEGFGVTQAFDIDKVLDHEYLFRLSNSVRMSREDRGHPLADTTRAVPGDRLQARDAIREPCAR